MVDTSVSSESRVEALSHLLIFADKVEPHVELDLLETVRACECVKDSFEDTITTQVFLDRIVGNVAGIAGTSIP